ncbi:hypothetical protein AVEN_187165-1 [Araneus ventricosus]|uniref:Uncharacterized protein n=1 Tax=Araneus ventricosus TaxID=182803 RepID=A0A4Y2WWE5_ARAVE|nr:hypothetical protein AVEN_187165-1 [Araneus ventricosus]
MEDIGDLRTDETYLRVYQICRIVASDNCSSDLLNLKPGLLVQTRWFTTTTSLFGFYVITEYQYGNFTWVVQYIMKVKAIGTIVDGRNSKHSHLPVVDSGIFWSDLEGHDKLRFLKSNLILVNSQKPPIGVVNC